MSSRLLLVPAAGRAVRMGGLLKELLPLGTRPVGDAGGRIPIPVLRHVLEAGAAADVDEVAIVTSSAKSATLMKVVDSFELGLRVVYVYQPEPTGLGAAVACAESQIRRHGATLLLMPDVLIRPVEATEDALRAVEDGSSVAVTLHRVERPERFGVARLEQEQLVGFVDKPGDPPTGWVWTAVAFTPDFLAFLHEARPATGEWGLTEALDAAARSHAVYPLFVTDGSFHDVGTYDGYLAALDEVEDPARRWSHAQ